MFACNGSAKTHVKNGSTKLMKNCVCKEKQQCEAGILFTMATKPTNPFVHLPFVFWPMIG
jgi:hypothetical protein